MKTRIRLNDIAISTSALCDTGAATKLLIRPSTAEKVAKELGVKIKKLKKPIPLQDFQGRPAGFMTHSLRATFEIDDRLFENQKFRVTDCSDEVIIGKEWLAKQGVWLHPGTHAFKWPESTLPLARFNPALERQTTQTRISPEVQRDADRRDAALEKDIQKTRRIQILKKSSWRPETPAPTETEAPLKVAALHQLVKDDPRQARWRSLPMPDRPIPIQALHEGALKMNHDEPIPFPSGESPEHKELVQSLIPPQLELLKGFFSKKGSTELPPSRPGHDVKLELQKPLEGAPPYYRTPLALLPLEAETTEELLRIGFIERCMEARAAPTLFVPKPHSDEKRFCVDFRWVNQFLKDRLVPAPDLNGTMEVARGAKRYTKLDIIRAFNRLLIEPSSRFLTAFRTRQGTFQWKVLPFGLKVGPAWWQDFVNAQLHELLDQIASAYADDVLIYSDKEEDHWTHVKEVIHRLHAAGLQGDIKKSRFNVTEVDYLGMILRAGEGVSIDPAKIKAITDWTFEQLVNLSAVRSFLGLTNYVRIFYHHHSDVAEPLNRLLKSGVPFKLGPEQRQAFEKLKELATSAPVLAFFDPRLNTRLECDASRQATGAALLQEHGPDEWKPTGYFSKTMTPTERAYPIQDRELLAVVQALDHFHAELAGKKFTVLTDHEALKYWCTKRKLSTRQCAWAHLIADHDLTFKYRKGSQNILADALSRKTIDLPTVKARELEERTMPLIPPEKIDEPDVPSYVTKIAALEEQENEAVVEKDLPGQANAPSGADLVDLIKAENRAQKLGKHNGEWEVPERTSDGQINLRTALIKEAHEPQIFAHQGINKTMQMLKKDYHWSSLSKDVRRYIKNCHACQRNKTRHDKTPGLLHPLPPARAVWEHVSADGKDMPKDKRGYDYVWRFVCRFSKILVTLPGKKTDDAETIAKRYYKAVYRLLGVPVCWYTDNGGQFISAFTKEINKLTGTKHRFGSAMHPQTQGAVEITNQELDQKLRFYVNHHQDDWSDYMPSLDFAHNHSWHSSIQMPPLKTALGHEPRNPLSTDLPAEVPENDQAKRARELVEQTKKVQDLAYEHTLKAQEAQRTQANKTRRPVDFGKEDMVFLNKKGFTTDRPTTRLDSQWIGPFKIMEERGHSYVLDMPDNFKGKNLFHADRLRKAPSDPMPGQHQTPPSSETLNGEPEWEVDKVLASRVNRRKLEYKVQWTGCDPDETWYPAGNLKNAATALYKFHEEYPDAAGPPVRLQDWLVAAAEDKFDDDHPDDDKPRKSERKKTRRHV